VPVLVLIPIRKATELESEHAWGDIEKEDEGEITEEVGLVGAKQMRMLEKKERKGACRRWIGYPMTKKERSKRNLLWG